MKKTRKPAREAGAMPPNAVAWCRYHQRGMNLYYIRRKHCLFNRRHQPCRHLEWL